MDRFPLTAADRAYVREVVATLSESQRVDLADPHAVAKSVGELRATVRSLLKILLGGERS